MTEPWYQLVDASQPLSQGDEHLSQAFARFFMRVGLPQPVTAVW